MDQEGLWMSGGHRPKLSFPIAPKVSFELDVEFTMKAGYQFGVHLPLNSGKTLLWVCGFLVIPYVVVLVSELDRDGEREKVLLLRRLKQGGEARLHDKLSIGVGGA